MSSGLLPSVFVFAQVSICKRYDTGRCSSVGSVSSSYASGSRLTHAFEIFSVESCSRLTLIKKNKLSFLTKELTIKLPRSPRSLPRNSVTE